MMPVMPDRPARGWWRRNLWGLLLVFPMIIVALAVPFVNDAYDRWFHLEPIVPVNGSHGAWADYADGRMRLLELAQVDIQNHSKKPVTVPGARVWRARAAFDTPTGDTYGGCKVKLEDAEGRTFDDRPQEISSAALSYDYGCTPPSDLGAKPSARPTPSGGGRVRFDNTYYFVLPASARAVAVRVFLATKAPRYARLTAP
jgi:hypothetical protein